MKVISATALPLTNLREILDSEYRGPKAGFSEAQVLKAIITIGDNGKIGRTKLGSELALGTGEIRTLIKRLKEAELISVDANGCELDSKGKQEYKALLDLFPWKSEVDGTSLRIGSYCYAIIARNGSKHVRLGIEQRDAAIKSGAVGALTLLFKRGSFVIPNEGTDCEKMTGSKEPWKALRTAKLLDGDAIVISGGNDIHSAEYGAWSAASTLYND